jgi:hypothetical protein
VTPHNRPRRSTLVGGLARGVERADVAGMAGAIGEGLVRVSEAWLPRGKLAVPQPCAIVGCPDGPYSSLRSLNQHLSLVHAGLSPRERSFLLDGARRAAVRQAMNGIPRSP